MKTQSFTYLALALCLFLPDNSLAATIVAKSSGNWASASTWDLGRVPNSTDDVIIDGYEVNIGSGTVTVASLALTNISNTDNTKLRVDGTANLTVTNDLTATAENTAHDVALELTGSGVLNVSGNVNFSRSADNNKGGLLWLYMIDDTRVNVSGDYTIDYQNSANSEAFQEILLEGNAILDITGSLQLYQRGGKNLDVLVDINSQLKVGANLQMDKSGGGKSTVAAYGSSLFQISGDVTLNHSGGNFYQLLDFSNSTGTATIGGNLNLNSTTADKIVKMEAKNGTNPSIAGNITMSALSDGDVLIDLQGTANLKVGGNIVRTDYGALSMQNNSTLTFNGTQAQAIPAENLPGSGTDAFSFSNLAFENTSGAAITLDGPLTVNDNLALTNGVIQTSSTNSLTLADGATITGGSTNAYIDGPIIKKGSTNGSSFVFPTGDGSTYAPLAISTLNNATSEYTAQYFKCPPPFGTNLNAGVEQLSSNEYWTLEATAGSEQVNVTLTWPDAVLSGIIDTVALVVAGYDPDNGWTSYGRSAATGGLGLGESGSITNALACPPPFGITKYTFGSVSALLNPLPVELTRFEGTRVGSNILLEWETAAEINAREFIVEKSEDGTTFRVLTRITASGNDSSVNRYSFTDEHTQVGDNYYRLVQEDNDGMREYSGLVVINIKSFHDRLVLYPNPVRDRIQIIAPTNNDQQTFLEVFDQRGRLIFSAVQTMLNGELNISAKDINADQPGHYIFRLKNQTGMHTLPFLKID